MLQHGLARRFAFRMLALPGVGKSTARTIIAFGAITALLSAFVSNTATVAMLLPTAVAILGTLAGMIDDKNPDKTIDPMRLRVGVALMLMLAYGASVGGLLTPVGSPPNLIGRGLIEEATGEKISFLEWVLAALPICLLMFVVLAVVLLLLNKPEIKRLEGIEEYVAEERARLGKLSVQGAQHADRLRDGGDPVDHARHRGDHRRHRVEGLRGRRRAPRRGHRRRSSPPRCCSSCRRTGRSASSRSPGPRPSRSTGARSCCSAPASSSARCWPTPASRRPSASRRPTRSASARRRRS